LRRADPTILRSTEHAGMACLACLAGLVGASFSKTLLDPSDFRRRRLLATLPWQHLYLRDRGPHDAFDNDRDMPAIFGGNDGGPVFIFDENTHHFFNHGAAGKAGKQLVENLRAQHEIELRFNGVLLGLRG
jgi:hypothetical protein